MQSIPADSWEKMKSEEPVRVEELIEKFSDVVFEKTLSNIEYLEFKTPNDIKTFHCLPEKIVMMGLFVEGNIEVDFRGNHSSEKLMELIKNKASLKLYSAEKTYKGDRLQELFKMMENGCLISKDGALFKTLSALK